MKYKDLLRIIGGDDAYNAVYSILIQAGRKEQTGLVMSNEEAEEFVESLYINDNNYKFSDWDELRDEISENIRECNQNYILLKRYVCSLLSPLEEIANYFDYDDSREKNDRVNTLILKSIARKQFPDPEEIQEWQDTAESRVDEYCTILESAGNDSEDNQVEISTEEYDELYEKFYKEEEEKYTKKWCNATGRLLAKVEFGLQFLGYIIQGSLLENGSDYTIFDFERECGVILVRKIEPLDLVNSMGWTKSLALTYLPETILYSSSSKLKWSDFPELQQAHKDGMIDNNGRLTTNRAAFVRYCREKKFFGNLLLEDWKPINNVLKMKNGRQISAERFKQSFQDIQQDEL